MNSASSFRSIAATFAIACMAIQAGSSEVRATQQISYTASPYMSTGVVVHDPFTNSNVSAWVGPINAHLTDAHGTGQTYDFRTYCVDMLRVVYIPSGTLDILDSQMVGGTPSFIRTEQGPAPGHVSVTTSDGARAAYLYATFNPQVTSVDQGVGLQLAIWSAIYNGQVTTGDLGLKHGDSSGQQFWVASGVSTAAYNDAKQYLAASLGKTGNADVFYTPANNVQWQLGGFAFVTPEPTTLAMAASGGAFGLLVALRRRRRTANAV